MQNSVYGPRYNVADIFCGCGGLSFGFEMTQRFNILLGLDIKSEALDTFAENHSRINGLKPVVIHEDIEKIDNQRFLGIISQFGVGELDCLIGGPPCEGFSQNRTDKESGFRTSKFMDDPRNHLFRRFISLAAELQPKVILIENVPDLVRHKDGETLNEVLTTLDTAGYSTSVKILNAADYGVPQIRRRAFFLAQRKSDLVKWGIKLSFPSPSHKSYPMMHESLISDSDWLPGDSGYWVNVREALDDLPIPTTDESGFIYLHDHSEARITSFRSLMRSRSDVIYNHIARKLGKNGLERLKALRPGQNCDDLPEFLRPKSYFHNSYTRLIWSEPARTITKFAYHVGSGQFGHPEKDRAITIREAARLQSFPDDFRFIGTTEIRKLSAMVGSAVPPLLAKAIARQVAQYLDEIHLLNMSPDVRREAKLLAGDAVLRRLEKESWQSNNTLEGNSNEKQMSFFRD